MKNIDKIIYAIRIFLFIGHFYLIFVLLNSILPVGLFGYIFLVIYVIYVSMILKQLISKKKKYKYDLIYNFMQIGFIVYLVIINYKIYHDHLYVVNKTLSYFKTNYLIMSLLLIFIIVYALYELKGRKDKEK